MKPSDLRESFLAFREQCIWLQCCYNTYLTLFESGDETRGALDTSAPRFFSDLNSVLIEYCLLQVCKITDPKQSMGRKNLTFEYLNDALRDEGRMTDEITQFSQGLAHYRDLIKDARNKLVSHLDKNSVLMGHPIGEHAKDEVTAFFQSLYGYVDAVGNAVGVGPLDFRTTTGPGDVLDLVKVLKRGLTSA